MSTMGQKIKQAFHDIAILKDPDNYSVFSGRNLPSFVKDFLIRKHIDSDGNLNKTALFDFLDRHIPDDNNVVKTYMRYVSMRLHYWLHLRYEI